MSKMIDLAREERMKKYDILVEELRLIGGIARIRKIAERKPKEDVGLSD